jgi:hypothetical protein
VADVTVLAPAGFPTLPKAPAPAPDAKLPPVPKVPPIPPSPPIPPAPTPAEPKPAPAESKPPTAEAPPPAPGLVPPPVGPHVPNGLAAPWLGVHPGYPGPNPAVPGDCCGPIGSHGPIGQEIYLRAGPSFPLGNDLLTRNLEQGWVVQGGGRSQFFNPAGDAAWVVDLHVMYTYNRGTNQDVFTFNGEPVTVRGLHRASLGLGVGQDYFLARPGFILNQWDANFRLGWDVGGRWGTGHVDMDQFLFVDEYRRNHDVFAQAFGGVMGSMELPCGAWTGLMGFRVESAYTFADFLPRDSSFCELNVMFMMGVRY